MWHVSSCSGVATLRTAIHLLLTYLLTKLNRNFKPSFHSFDLLTSGSTHEYIGLAMDYTSIDFLCIPAAVSRRIEIGRGYNVMVSQPRRLKSRDKSDYRAAGSIPVAENMGALSDTAIRPSVSPSLSYSTLVAWRSCLGYRHAGCLQLAGHQRCADCGPVRGRT